MSDDFSEFPVAGAAPAAAAPAADVGFDAFPRADAAAAPVKATALGDNEDSVSRGVANKRLEPSVMDQLLMPWRGETPSSLAKQNAFARARDYREKINTLTRQVVKDDPSLGTLAAAAKADEMYAAKYGRPPETEINWSELPKQLWSTVTDRPAQFLSEMIKGLVVDPEMLAATEIGVAAKTTSLGKSIAAAGTKDAAKAAVAGASTGEKAAMTGVQLADSAATMGVQSAGIEGMKQIDETGSVKPKGMAQAAAGGAAMGAAFGAAHVALKMGADVGLQALAKRKGAAVTPEVRAEFDAAVDKAVAEGASPTDALIATLKKHGMEDAQADAIGAVVAEHEPAVTRTGRTDQAARYKVPGERTDKAELGEQPRPPDDGAPPDEPPGAAPADGESPTAPSSRGGDSAVGEEPSTADDVNALLAKDPIKPSKSHDEMDAQRTAAHDEAAMLIEQSPEGWSAKDSHSTADMVLTRDTNGEGWRITQIDAEGNPLGHVAYDTLSQAAREFAVKAKAGTVERRVPSRPDELPPLEFTKEPAPEGKASPEPRAPDDGTWFHYTREPGVRELSAHKSNPGNARGAGVYLSKDAAYSASHKAPRVDKQGNLAPKAKDGELLTTRLEPEREARLFDEDTMHTPDEARGILEKAGMTSEESGAVVGKRQAVSGKSVNAALKKFMGGWEYSNFFLKDIGYTGVKFRDAAGKQLASIWNNVKAEPYSGGKQAGRIDPKLLMAMGLATLGASAVYALSDDRAKAIAAAAAMGALPFAGKLVSRLGRGNAQLAAKLWTDARFPTKHIFRDYARNVQVMNYAVDAWQRGLNAMLKGVPDKKASLERIRDYTQGHRNMTMSPQELAVAAELRKYLDTMGQWGMKTGVLGNMLPDYLPGIYQKKPFASWRDIIDALTQEDAFRGNYTGMSPNSRHALKKIIPDYRAVDALIAAGKLDIVPLTHDPIQIAALYAKSLNKTIANRQLVETLKKTPGPSTYASGDFVPLAVGITTKDAAARIAQSNAIIEKQFNLPAGTKEIMNKFAILNAPHDYVAVKHPALEGVRVHKDIAEPLKLLFDTSDPGAISKALYAVSMAQKSALFAFSMFHAGALATVGATVLAGRLATAGVKLTQPAMWKAIPDAFKALRSANLEVPIVQSLEGGLTLFHHVQDVDPSILQRGMNLAEKYATGMPLYTGMPVALPVKALKFAHAQINHMMWDVIHPTLKLATWMAETKRWAEKNPQGDIKQAQREIATSVNTLYGGINWFELANNVDGGVARTLATALFSPQGRRWQQVLLLAPDWNIAALGAWTEGMKASMPGIPAKASDSLYRTYLFTSAMLYMGMADYLQKKLTGEHIWQKADWTYVDMGDGRRIQLNKHFMEGVHLLTSPEKFILNKLNFVPKETLAQVFHKEYVTPSGGPPMKEGRAMHAAKSLVKPIFVDNLMNDPASAVGGFFGIPIYGRTYEQQEAMARKEATAAGKDPEKAAQRVTKRRDKATAKRKTQ